MTRSGQSFEPTSDATVRETAHAALSNLATVLRLADEGRIKCSEKTKRPNAASIALLTASLDGGDFYDASVDEPIAAFACRCCSRPAGWRRCPAPACSRQPAAGP